MYQNANYSNHLGTANIDCKPKKTGYRHTVYSDDIFGHASLDNAW